MRVYNTVLEPTLTYGSESWPTQDKHISKVTAVQMKVLRRTIGKTKRDKIRNEKILQDLDQKPISGKIERNQLRWYGHVNRMDETRKPKQYMQARPEGRKQRGRQRVTYLDTVERIGMRRGKSLRELEKMTRDRKVWKTFI